MLESKIQASIIKVFENAGWYCVKIMKSNKNGYPDLEMKKNGYSLPIEVKQPGKKPTPLQEYRHKELRSYGFEVSIMTDKKDALEWLTQHSSI